MFWTILAAIVVAVIIFKILAKIKQRLQDPIGKARRIIDKEIKKTENEIKSSSL